MELSRKSLNSKLYRWFYGTKELPTSLCPYFWKLPFAWLFVIPNIVITLPHIIAFELFSRPYEVGEIKPLERISVSFVMFLFLFGLFSMGMAFSLFFVEYKVSDKWLQLSISGAILWAFIIVGGIIELIKGIREKNIEKKVSLKFDSNGNYIKQELKSNIIVEFIKAKYNKYCTKIDWVD